MTDKERIAWIKEKYEEGRPAQSADIKFLLDQLNAARQRETEATKSKNRTEKAFALLCRELDDFSALLPCQIAKIGWPECDGEMGQCGDRPVWACWQKYIYELVDAEQVCRICGCTQNNACQGGCYWVESDLCSACAAIGDPLSGEEHDGI
jgi:hypothetical protein